MTSYTIDILGVKIHLLDMDQVVERIREFLESPRCHHVITANSELVVRAQEDGELCRVIEGADLTVADGAGILWAGRVFGTPLPGRVPGIDLMERLLGMAEAGGHKVFLLGASEGVAEQAAKRMLEGHPGLQIAGTLHGYFSAHENNNVVNTINRSKADLLFVALGAPRQEKWIAANRKALRCSVAMGVGGSFDVYAGLTKRAPRWMGELGLEWLFRLVQQPKRFWRMLALPQFVFRVLHAKWIGGYRKL